jgi:hypothetical protein
VVALAAQPAVNNVAPTTSQTSSQDSTAALQALMTDDSFWRQSKPQSYSQMDGSDWNQVLETLAREAARRRGE